MSLEEVIAKIRDHETELKSRGVSHLSLFGSRARGDPRPDSDLDVLIEGPSADRPRERDLLAISGRLSEITGFDVSLAHKDRLAAKIAARISDDLIEVF